MRQLLLPLFLLTLGPWHSFKTLIMLEKYRDKVSPYQSGFVRKTEGTQKLAVMKMSQLLAKL